MKDLAVVFNNKIKKDQQIITLRKKLEQKIPSYLKQRCGECNAGTWYYIFSVLNVNSFTMSEEELKTTIDRIVEQHGNVKDTPNLLKLAIREAEKYKAGDDIIHNLLPNIIAERLIQTLSNRVSAAAENLMITLYGASSVLITDNG